MLIATELRKLKAVFPAIENDFISVLSERLKSNEFTEKRLKDSIGFVIDNFEYQKPNIANIISFDKKIKLYTHNEVCLLVTGHEASFEDFAHYRKNGTLFWIKKTDKIKYNIKDENL
jgi:hypothetical protein